MNGFAKFELPEKVIYGQGAMSQLGDVASEYGTRALVVSDRIMEKVGLVQKVTEELEKKGITCTYYLDANTEPTDLFVADALKICQDGLCDLIVSIGGGSCIDTAKAVAGVATNGGFIGDYMGGKTMAKLPALPLIVLPTTAGTGSEVTNVTIISNTSNDVKMMIKQKAFLPRVAIVDPLLTVTTPKNVTAATGIDALCHAVEAYISRKAQPVTSTFALSAISLIVNNLRNAYDNGSDLDAREKMALASMEAGIAFSNSSVTLVHGMSRPIGAIFHVPHGVSNAMLLPAVLEFTKAEALDRLAEIGRVISPSASLATDGEWADEAIREITKLCGYLSIPNMQSWGIRKEELDKWAQKMATDAIASGSPGNTPRVPTHEEVVALYTKCYDFDFKLN